MNTNTELQVSEYIGDYGNSYYNAYVLFTDHYCDWSNLFLGKLAIRAGME